MLQRLIANQSGGRLFRSPAARFRDARRVLQMQQGVECGLDDVVRIRRAQRLRQHVLNSRNLHHGAHRTAGDHACSFRRGLQQNLARAIGTQHLMRDGGTLEVQLHHILLGLLDRFADGHGNFASLAHAESSVTALIAHDDERRKTEILAALHNFRDAVDRNHLIFQVGLVGLHDAANRKRILELLFRHGFQNCRPASRAASASACTRPWY